MTSDTLLGYFFLLLRLIIKWQLIESLRTLWTSPTCLSHEWVVSSSAEFIRMAASRISQPDHPKVEGVPDEAPLNYRNVSRFPAILGAVGYILFAKGARELMTPESST